MYSLPIVVIAYNRPDCLKRILNSLSKANYAGFQNITLIISIDYHPENKEVLRIAKNLDWEFGEKIIRSRKTNLGLRKHILKCGDYSQEYGGVIVLEDDLLVSPAFYSYATKAMSFSKNNYYIGGISLYNDQLSQQTCRNFSPLEDGYDNWYFQRAASWGQCWSKAQWLQFRKWYDRKGVLEANPKIPINVTLWSEKSWLKYFIAYLIETDKYFLYPKISLSTNFSEAGTHNSEGNTSFQVPLRLGIQHNFIFSTLSQSSSVYDAFFENNQLPNYLGINSDKCTVDLNGYKPLPKDKQYLLTTKKLNYEIEKSFGLKLRPLDYNVMYGIAGNDIYLYNLFNTKKNSFTKNKYHRLVYNYKIVTLRDSIFLSYAILKKRLILKMMK